MTKKQYWLWFTVIVAIAAYLRLVDLGRKALWVDEAFFYFLAQETLPQQEFIPCLLAKFIQLFTPLTEFWLRLPFALAGIGMVVLVALHQKNPRWSLVVAFFVATFPLFVFWSKMARPYALAAFFVTLGWRYSLCSFLAVFTTPISILGLDFIKFYTKIKNNESRTFYIAVIVLIALAALGTFFIRPDTEKNWINFTFLSHAKRLWIVPLTAFCFYCLEYLLPFLQPKAANRNRRKTHLER